MTIEATPIAAGATDGDKIRCDACPVMCYIKPGASGACDRYANDGGTLVRVDDHLLCLSAKAIGAVALDR